MSEKAHGNRRGVSDATDYSSTQAPETQRAAEGRHPLQTDERLLPGGARGATEDPGISTLDRDRTLGGGNSPDETDQMDVGGTEDRDRT